MFTEKKYQIKELTDIFGISRDSIKYYEQAGLITSVRKENGYREFDEFNVLKLKKVLHFRSMNMTIDEIVHHFECDSMADRMEAMRNVRLRTEQEILELNKKLKKLRILETTVSDYLRFTDGFNLANDLCLCINCPHITDREDKHFYIKIGFTADYSTAAGISNIRHCNFVAGNHTACAHCVGCDRRMHFRQCYRARFYFENEEQILQLLHRQTEILQLQGMQPEGKLYVLKKIVKENGEDRLIFDILIPLAE